MKFYKKVFLYIMACLMLAGITACSTEPVYYSKSEVKQYVKEHFGKSFKLVDEKSYKDDSEEQNMMYEYIFENKEGIVFSVYTSTRHIWVDASESIFYDKAISNNYIDSVVKYHIEEIKEICEGSALDIELDEDNAVKIFLNTYEQIDDAADVVAEIDGIVSLEYEGKMSGYSDSPAVWLKPNNIDVPEDWKTNYDYRICAVSLSSDEDERLKKDAVATYIERSLANRIKDNNIDFYSVPDEILYKYPATRIKVVSINGNDNVEGKYGFVYDVETEAYWMSYLDLCQDFEGFPYNYTKVGKFAELVNLLGGTYECREWKAVWRIGDNTWEGELLVDDECSFKKLIVTRNGEKVELSAPWGTNGTVSGRCYTPKDLEQMLNADVIIDQVSMTATIELKDVK